MADSEEEDYMTMTFPTSTPTTTAPETSLQRRQRLRREAEARSRPKSKAELAEEERMRREAALSTSLLPPSTGEAGKQKSKGLAMMSKMGFTGGALGKKREGEDDRVTEPIRIEVKEGREGLGMEGEKKRRWEEVRKEEEERGKKAKVDEGEYRERVRREREEKRLGGLVEGAMKVAERMDEEKMEGSGKGRTSKGVPVVWRGLVRKREEEEREKRMRRILEEGLARGPVFEDDEEDGDDRVAMGKEPGRLGKYVDDEEFDDEDPELEEFNALPVAERLQRVVKYLREEHRYCFWCKFAYPDPEMEGCMGLTEEDHD